MKKQQEKTYGVLIGRFQPIHKGHLHLITYALKKVDKLIILVGSQYATPSLRNPWTYEERAEIILASIAEEGHNTDQVLLGPIRDYTYNNTAWVANVQNVTSRVIPRGTEKVTLFGMYKDDTSWYLDMFPQWRKDMLTNSQIIPGNATDLRNAIFQGQSITEWSLASEAFKKFVSYYKLTSRYEYLRNEFAHLVKYKAPYAALPYEPIFVTTDALVFISGHVLLVKRGRHPGKGLLALPGGFLAGKETIVQSMIRELKEETGIMVPKEVLMRSIKEIKVYDHPKRSERGRTVTHVAKIDLGKGLLPTVKGGDDASGAFWLSLSDVAHHENEFFEDHYHIINNLR